MTDHYSEQREVDEKRMRDMYNWWVDTTKPPQIELEVLTTENRYQRQIISLHGTKSVVDVYRVLEAFEVDSHAIAHAIKKLLAPGKRHAKSREQDLREAIKSIEAELLLMEQRNG